MSRAYFICGTGTDVGKSVVCAGLLKNMPQARAIKIVQTGPELFDQNLYTAACPHSQVKTLRHFKLPASPHLAAASQSQSLDLAQLARDAQKEVQLSSITLLEGSGGLLCPLSATHTFLDLIATLDYPVILVVNNVLGAINHALLSLMALKQAGLKLEGLIFTHSDASCSQNHPIALDNIKSIREHCPARLLGVVPHLPELARPYSAEKAWGEVAACLKGTADHLLATQKETAQAEPFSRFDQEHLWHPYSSAPQSCAGSQKSGINWLVEKTADNCIYLKNGRKLLDGMSSWWCAIHGYGRPDLLAALTFQAQKMSHVMFGGLTHEPAIELGQSLLKILPSGLDKIFWVDSGSVSVEVALKMAAQYWQGRGSSEKIKIISHYGAYHGDTLGAMSVGDPVNGMHALLKGFLPEQLFVPRPSTAFHAPFETDSLHAVEQMAKKHQQQCAAIIIEPIVQGAGGMWMYHPDYLKGLRKICDRYDLLLIYDEIATGFGRTGKMFATEWAGVCPDILCLGKALTAGTMTLAATVCTAELAKNISRNERPLMHGPTFMANPLACRVAQANLACLQTGEWEEQVRSIQKELEQGLAGCREQPLVKDVRVLGAIGVVEMKSMVNINKLRAYCAQKHGVWLRPFNNLIYTMPPYTVTSEECLRLTRAISQAIEEKEWV